MDVPGKLLTHRVNDFSKLKAVIALKMAHFAVMQERSERGVPQSQLITLLKSKQIDATLPSVNLRGRKDVLAVLPTGYGKTLLFNLIPMYCSLAMKDDSISMSVVIAPLNALIDQHLKTLGWNATRMTTG